MSGLIFLAIFSVQVAAKAFDGARSSESVFQSLANLMPLMCKPSSTLRVCFSVNQKACESRVNSAFENCLRDQKIKYAGRPALDSASASAAEEDLKKCVLDSYSMASMTSYRKSADCDKWVPKKKVSTVSATKKLNLEKTGGTAFEDPLDEQRDLFGRYKLRLLHDVRMTDKLRNDMKARSTCLNDKKARETNINCFKRMLAEFEVTSSVQVPLLGVIAVAAALKDKAEGFSVSTGQLVDVVLASAERAQIQKFHLWNFMPKSDADRVALNQLRVQDEELMRSTFVKLHKSLSDKMKQPSKIREPASLPEVRMRLDALNVRRWSYAQD